MSIQLGHLYQSPKHGLGQVVDYRHGKFGAPLWIVRYTNGSFGSYYSERLESEMDYCGAKALPHGFPKIAMARSPELVAYHARRIDDAPRPQRVDERGYCIIFTDFIKRVVIRKEVKR